ncbi:MAG: GGDEF domain-containing protein [Longimicrobiales bacterium]
MMQGARLSLLDVQPYIAYLGTIVQWVAALLLALLFLVVHRQAPRRAHFLSWYRAWVALVIALSAVVLRYNILPSFDRLAVDDTRPVVQALYAIYQGSKLAFYAFLAAGVLHYVRGSMPARFVLVTALSGVLYLAASLVYATNLDQFVSLQGPAVVFAAAACTLMMFRLPVTRRSIGTRVMAYAFAATMILWAVYFAAFGVAGPLVSLYPGPQLFGYLVRYNSFFDVLLHCALACGMIMLLVESVRREIADAQAELAVARDPQRRASLHDSVTGSLNRRAYQEGIGMVAVQAGLGAVLALDLDELRAINVAHGHAAGDAVLRYVVEILRKGLRATDKLYRWGGDEFLLVLPGADPVRAKRRLQQLLEHAAPLGRGSEGSPLPVLVSMGAAAYNGGPDLRRAIEHADEDMYREKHRRRRMESGQLASMG